MNTIDRNLATSNTINATKDDPSTKALASVRADLLVIPRAAVRRPYEDVPALTASVLAAVAAARPATPEEEVRLSRLEVLARALDRAHAITGERPSRVVTTRDHQFAAAEKKFVELDELVDVLVRRGAISRRDVPRPARRVIGWRPQTERCAHILEVTSFLRDFEGGDVYARRLVQEAERLASKLFGPEPEVPGRIPATELRDRAYTALRQALDTQAPDAKTTEGSGVFSIAGLPVEEPTAVAS